MTEAERRVRTVVLATLLIAAGVGIMLGPQAGLAVVYGVGMGALAYHGARWARQPGNRGVGLTALAFGGFNCVSAIVVLARML